jgi:inosose dehydratase
MTNNAKIALNPLPWVLTERGFELSVPVLRQTFSEIASTPFKAIQADPPRRANARGIPLPSRGIRIGARAGLFLSALRCGPTDQIAEGAKRHAAVQAELGNTEVFIAANGYGIRMKRPTVGANTDPATLAKVNVGLGAGLPRRSPPSVSDQCCTPMSALRSRWKMNSHSPGQH